MVGEVVVIGVIATLTMDLWQRLLQAIGIPMGSWGLVGRWVAGLPRGILVHRPITASPAVHNEVAIGWAFHYAVGIAYAALYLAILKLGFGSMPTLGSALLFSIALLVAPWFACSRRWAWASWRRTPQSQQRCAPSTFRCTWCSASASTLAPSLGAPPRLNSVLLHREHRARGGDAAQRMLAKRHERGRGLGGEGARYKDLLVERPA